MKLRCSSCSFELNLTIKSLPKNAKLYCPKCKNVLNPVEQDISQVPEVYNPVANAGENMPLQTNVQIPPPVIPPPFSVPPPSPPAFQQSTNPPPPAVAPVSQPQLFSEDIKPEFELTQTEVQQSREALFAKPEQVWYDSSAAPPPVPPVQSFAPPPIPAAVPPPIPANIPPPIPVTSQPAQSGYISASSSIQIDSSLVMPENQSVPASRPFNPPIAEEKIELATEIPEIQPVQTVQEEDKKPATSESPRKAETAEKKDVIILSSQPYTVKKTSITIPAISLIVLACIAGFIYYQIVVSSSKSDLIKDLKSTPALGAIPAIQNRESQEKPATGGNETQTSTGTSKTAGTKIPVKAKKSALEHYKKGNQYFMESKYEQARDEYAMAIAADPTFGLAYRGLGTTYAKLGQPDLAVKNYEKYIEVMPNASDAEQVKNIIKQYYGK